jgi:hypothetical protein
MASEGRPRAAIDSRRRGPWRTTKRRPRRRSVELLDQEHRLVLPSLDENGAVAIGLSIVQVAIARVLTVTIEVRLRDRVVFRAARNGTDATYDQYIGGKARLVERFGHASLYERLRHEAEGTTFEAATTTTPTGPVPSTIVAHVPRVRAAWWRVPAVVVECLATFAGAANG